MFIDERLHIGWHQKAIRWQMWKGRIYIWWERMFETMTEAEYFIVMVVILVILRFVFENVGRGLIRLW
jgi:hypothetical protein